MNSGACDYSASTQYCQKKEGAWSGRREKKIFCPFLLVGILWILSNISVSLCVQIQTLHARAIGERTYQEQILLISAWVLSSICVYRVLCSVFGMLPVLITNWSFKGCSFQLISLFWSVDILFSCHLYGHVILCSLVELSLKLFDE